MTRMTSSIVRTARCTAPPAVTAIAFYLQLSGLRVLVCRQAAYASHGVHGVGKWGKHHDAGFCPRRYGGRGT
jgi:hypothetical protein